MGVRDFKDKEWDARYEQFKLAKERRRQAENAPVTNTPVVRPENTIRNHRNEMAAKKEERVFVNKGPSRYLKNYVSNTQKRESNVQSRPAPQIASVPAAKITIIKDDDKEVVNDNGDEMVAVEPESEKSKSPSLDIIPYILILFAIVIIVLKLTKVV